MNMSQGGVVSIWNASYSLEKNSILDGGVTSFTNQARMYTDIVHVISRLIDLISQLGHGIVD